MSHEEKQPETVKTEGVRQTGETTPDNTSGLFVLVFWAVIGLGAAWYNEKGRAFLLQWKWWLLGAVVLLATALLFGRTRDALAKVSPKGRLALLIYGVVPGLIALVLGVAFLRMELREIALRFVFLTVVCLLPATMFYVFVFTRKDSLLSEFVANLDRLGLLKPTGPESQAGRLRRLYTYLLRFQAAYGPLQKNQVASILGKESLAPTDDGGWSEESFSDTGSILGPETTIPVIIATVLIAIGWLISLPPRGGAATADWLQALLPQQNPICYAFLGAYLFALQLLFRRYVRRDLRPNAFMAVSIRILIALLGTWGALQACRVLGKEMPEDWKLTLAFIIGFFPRVAWQVIASAAKKISSIALPSLENPLPVSDLAGLTVWHEARLEEEDIENIPNMATADIAELMLTTRFPPDRIVDWVDEAILRTALGPEKDDSNSARAVLGKLKIRTASELLEDYWKKSDAEQKVFEKLPAATDGQLGAFGTLVSTLPTNPNLALIQRWRGLTTESDRRLTPTTATVARVVVTSQP